MGSLPDHTPNLFIVGAMKSGTTSLHNYLACHPNIYMSELKEPGFFVKEINWNKGFLWYFSLFQNSKRQHYYRGESSTDYTKLPIYEGVAERIKAFNPDARIIYVMRHPFDRIVSHYWFGVRHISTGGLKKDFYAACTSDPRFVNFSNYPMQIRPYLEAFGKRQVLMILFEDLLQNPKTIICQILQWLEVKETIDEKIFEQAWNVRPEIIDVAAGMGILNQIAYSEIWGNVSSFIPKVLRKWIRKKSIKTIDPKRQQANIERLRHEMQGDIAKIINEMSEIMKRDLAKVWKV